MSKKYYSAIGRRKTAVARVGVEPQTKGSFVVNELPLVAYFKSESHQLAAARPLGEIDLGKTLAIRARVSGGGIAAQAGAIAHGLSRALVSLSPELKGHLKRSKLLTRDAREKERRKFGLKKARKAPQWSKR